MATETITATGTTSATEINLCRVCQETFPTYEKLLNHKLNARRHFCCNICHTDFKNEDALRSHKTSLHAQAQNLECPFCHRRFTRVGGLVSHYELTECKGMPKQLFDEARKIKTQRQSDIAEARNFQDFSRSATAAAAPLPIGLAATPLLLDAAPKPPPSKPGHTWAAGYHANAVNASFNTGFRPAAPSLAASFVLAVNAQSKAQPTSWSAIASDNAPQQGSGQHGGAQNVDYGLPPGLEVPGTPIIKETDDLISFDEVSAILNSPWGTTGSPIKPCMSEKHRKIVNPNSLLDTPVLPGTPAPRVAASFPPIPRVSPGNQHTQLRPGQLIDAPPAPSTTVWATTSNLFPDAPPAVQPPVKLMQFVAISRTKSDSDDLYDPLDPDSRSFKPAKYYIEFTGKYKCPHHGCGKSSPNSNAFKAHLRSPAHRNEKLQCSKCLRYYQTATALTQHSESQGVRCTVRHTENYNTVVDTMTAGRAGVDGQLADDTVKYVVKPVDKVSARGVIPGDIIAAHRVAHQAHNDAINTYWDTRNAKW